MNRQPMLRALVLAAAMLAFLVAASPAAAQAGRDRNRLQRELEKTDEVLDRAADSARDALNPRPREMVAHAEDLQKGAWAAFNGSQFVKAFNETRAARDEAFRAIRLSEGEFRAVERIRNLLESTQGLVDEAASVVPSSGDEQAIHLLDAGRWQLGRAREAFRDRRFRQGLALALTARDLLMRALRATDENPGSDAQRLHEVIDRTEALAQEAEHDAGENGDSKAKDLVGQGRRLLADARDAARDGRPEIAYRHALAARERFLDALRLGELTLQPAEVKTEVESTRRLLDSESARIRESGVDEAHRLLDEAGSRQKDAEAHLAGGRLRPALTETKLAEALVRKALDLISP